MDVWVEHRTWKLETNTIKGQTIQVQQMKPYYNKCCTSNLAPLISRQQVHNITYPLDINIKVMQEDSICWQTS